MGTRQIACAMLIAGVSLGIVPPASAASQDRSSEAQGRSIQARLRAMDRDNDGVITRAEWRGSDEGFREQDTNDDGVLSGDEVRFARRRGADPYDDERLPERRTFAVLDRNDNGVITSGEWDRQADEFRALDSDGDGVLTRQEYRQSVVPDSSPAYRAGRDRGLADGRQAGREDRTVNGGVWDLDGQRELEGADAGYNASMG
ncbi:MAG: EF-hand domain-containing protein, partial [Burkholderiales bacterium]